MSDCIIWEGSKDAYGYGVRRINKRIYKAHRVALAHAQGIDLPPSSVACLHSCDNRACINPEHLRWGSQRDNIEDAVAKNRMAKKLSIAQAEAIRADHRPLLVISAEYGITQSTVSRIRNGVRRLRRK